MTNFILRNPSAVFVHVPKTGGTSVRAALGCEVQARFFGHIPKRYEALLRFSIIREPKDRFMSGFAMFKYGNMLAGDYYAEPRWPDLTISDALDVLEDPWIGHDRSARKLDWNLKHHLIPQTHPFNCLAHAKHILRFEQLEADFAQLCAKLDIDATLPQLRVARQKAQECDIWHAADAQRFDRIFARDYCCLGYAPSAGAVHRGPKMHNLGGLETAHGTVHDLWPLYFSDQTVTVDTAADALPASDCALEVFADDVIPGHPDTPWAGRSKNLVAHFRKLQPEFSGASRLSHLLACTIVTLRRAPDCAPALALFWRIMDTQFDAIRSELSLRWLVAISDTIADFGRDPGEAAVGLSASVFANASKLHESELKVFYPKRPWPPNKRMTRGGELFDGMLTFWTEKGDLMDNMFARAAKTADLSPTAGKVLMEVVERLRKGPTVYRRFARIAGDAPVPVLDREAKKKLNNIVAKKL